MSTTDRVAQLFAEANPVPDPDRLEIPPGAMARSATKEAPMPAIRLRDPVSPSKERRRVAIAVLSGALVVVVGVATWALLRDGAAPVAAPGEVSVRPTEPVAVVEAFFAAWNAGDVEEALSYVDPGVRAPTPFLQLPAFMDYSLAFSTWQLTDCRPAGPAGTVQCFVALADDPVASGLGLGGSTQQFAVSEGRLTFLNLPDYRALDLALLNFASERAPDATAAACADPGDGSAASEAGVTFNRACGEHLASFAEAYAAGTGG